jgi:hypothetical protein
MHSALFGGPIACGITGGAMPPYVVFLVECATLGTSLDIVARRMGREGNEYLLGILACGFVAWKAAFGVLDTFGRPDSFSLNGLAILSPVRPPCHFVSHASPSESEGPQRAVSQVPRRLSPHSRSIDDGSGNGGSSARRTKLFVYERGGSSA